MLYKLRKNAVAFADKENGSSIFSCVRSAIMPGFSYAEALSHEAQELSVIAEKIIKLGIGGFVFPQTPKTLAELIEETLKILEENGFVISGNTDEELDEKEIACYRHNKYLDDLPTYREDLVDKDYYEALEILQNDPNVIEISNVFDWKEYYTTAFEYYTEKKNKGFNVWASPISANQDCIVFIVTKD